MDREIRRLQRQRALDPECDCLGAHYSLAMSRTCQEINRSAFVLSALEAGLQHSDINHRWVSYKGLVALGDSAIRHGLNSAKHHDAGVRLFAVGVLRNVGHYSRDDVINTLVALLQDPDEDVVYAVEDCLRMFREDRDGCQKVMKQAVSGL